MAIETRTLMRETITVRTNGFIRDRAPLRGSYADSTPAKGGTALAPARRMITTVRAARLRRLLFAPALVLAVYFPTRPSILMESPPDAVDSLWEEPVDIESANLFDGPWGGDRAPDPDATFTFLRPKAGGINPGVVVADPAGRVWRVLSAVGYHQPPVYFLPSFSMATSAGRKPRTQAGGRFRLQTPSLKDIGSWSWQRNPFVGTPPHQGLLVILALFNSTDLKEDNNTLYRVSSDGEIEHWYVVRDLGAALGENARFAPRGDDVARYEGSQFITGVGDGLVQFANKSPYQRLFQRRITVDDVRWAGNLLA